MSSHAERLARGEIAATGAIDPACMEDGAPGEINPRTGQHTSYWVLSDAERAKGFVRPVRRSYKHVGIRPQYATRALTPDEQERYKDYGYVRFEPYPSESGKVGRYWTQDQLSSGCGSVTTMNQAIAETYARDPKFYGSTFCCQCGKHLRLEEFTWEGTTEVVGS